MLLGAISGTILVFWGGSNFVTANTPEPKESTLAVDMYLFLTIEGETSGNFEGDVTEAGKEGFIECITYQHSVVSPRDAASGLPTGKRQHKPFVITKAIDKATPLLYQACATNENLLNVTLYFYRQTILGAEENYFTIRLENAHIASMQTYMPPDPYDRPTEQVAFVYEKIIWTHEIAGLESSDTWMAADT